MYSIFTCSEKAEKAAVTQDWEQQSSWSRMKQREELDGNRAGQATEVVVTLPMSPCGATRQLMRRKEGRTERHFAAAQKKFCLKLC